MFNQITFIIFLVLYFFNFSANAQFIVDLVNPKFWLSVSNCVLCNPKQSAYIQNKKVACQTDLKIYECNDFVKKYPELQPNLKNCDENTICNEMLFNSQIERLDCLNGFTENIYDFVSIFKDIVNPKISKNLRQMCLKHADCSKELIAFDTEYKQNLLKFKTQKINGLTGLYSNINDPALLKLTSISTALVPRSIYKKYFPEEFQETKIPSKEEFQKFLAEGFDKQFRSMDCLNTKARAQLMCYWFFSVVDPLAAAKILKLDKGISQLVKVLSKDRRTKELIESEDNLKYFKPKETKIARSPQRQQFIDKNLYLETSTYQERLDFMKLVDAQPSKNRVFIDFENSQLKYLNDSLKDKDFITSVDNFANNKMLEKLQKLAQEYKPPLKISKLSDGKGVSFAIEGELDPDLFKELSQISNETNKETSKILIDSKLVRTTDEPQKWFKTGVGQTIDEANLASRFSRGAAGENKAYRFSDPAVQENLGTIYQFAKEFSKELSKEPSLSKFMQTVETSEGLKKIPNLELFENMRKYPNVEDFQKAMKLKYEVDISETVAQKALDYAKIVDDLNPKILVADQSVVTFKSTTTGGMTMDRKGMGAMNQESTALAIAKSPSFNKFPTVNRQEEKIVTARIEEERKKIKKALDADSRGDDTAKDDNYTLERKREIIKSEVAENRRIVFVPENTPDLATKQQLSTHGEGLEKVLTDDVLLGKISYKKQKQIRFSVDMKTVQLNEGKVDLIIQPTNGVTLTPSERKTIRDSFNEAVQEFNKKQKEAGSPTNYYFK